MLLQIDVVDSHAAIISCTLVFRISIGPTLIYFSNFSHAYALIQVPTLISIQEFENITWNLPE